MIRTLPPVVVAVASAALCAGCIDPLVSDELPPAGLVLPAGTPVPDAYDDPAIAQQIRDNDGVEGVVPLLSGFADGASTRFWDLGPAPDFAAPLFLLVRKDAEGNVSFVDHNTIIDAIPGDPGYSPYWAVLFLEVTDAYAGELIPSFAAVEEAQELGLVQPPQLQAFAVNCPAVADDVALDVGGAEPLAPPTNFFWQGRTVRYYDFGTMPVADGVFVPDANMYVLRREGQEPLSEPDRGVDITGDGDVADTNHVFAQARDDEEYTHLCRTVEVVVPSDYGSIDTSGDQEVADFTAEADMFDPDPVPGAVVAFDVTEALTNCPQQQNPGGL